MKTPPAPGHEQLDLSIPDMDTREAEESTRHILESLPGVHAVRLIERGAWIDYVPRTVSRGEILAALHLGGFHASLFQDSLSGDTGSSSV